MGGAGRDEKRDLYPSLLEVIAQDHITMKQKSQYTGKNSFICLRKWPKTLRGLNVIEC